METTIVRAELPARLFTQMESLISDGWFQDMNDLIVDALRRFLEAHHLELMERCSWDDVEWGLQGEY